MSRADRVVNLLKLGLSQPKYIAKSIRYFWNYGYIGTRERLYKEALIEEDSSFLDNAEAGRVNGGIKFSVIMPIYNVERQWLEEAIASVENQTYGNWELCIVDDGSADSDVTRSYIDDGNSQIKVKLLKQNVGISKATNTAIEMSEGDYVVLLDNDDLLTPDALYEFYLRLSITDADIVYSDNEVIDASGKRIAVFFKPDWSPDLFLSQMYVGHLLGFKRSLFDSVGGFRSEFDGSQDYDLLLRMILKTENIEHVAKSLYSWRAVESSTAANPNSKPYAQGAGLRAIQDYLDNKYGKGYAVVNETDNLFVYDVRYSIEKECLASIIIPNKDHVDDLQQAIESIISKTEYQNYEIIIVDNDSVQNETFEYYRKLTTQCECVRVISVPTKFNWSKLNNSGVDAANGNVFVFLNNDVVIREGNWLTRLVENSLRADIGLVGGLLLYPDGTIQHAGVVVGMGGWADHVYKGSQPIHYGNPFVSPMVPRNVSAITGACMAMSRKTYNTINGFDEDFIVCGSDVEACLHAEKIGLRNLYLPSVCLTHYESKTRDPKKIPYSDFDLSKRLYREYLASGDPYYNKNLNYQECTPTPITRREKIRENVFDNLWVDIPEIKPIRISIIDQPKLRLNLLIPSINIEDVYGGIATALKVFTKMVDELGCCARILVMDSEPHDKDFSERFPGYTISSMGDEALINKEIISIVCRSAKTLTIGQGDWFLCTSWWSAYNIQDELERIEGAFNYKPNPLVYLIQDYEPGFYAWSSRYLLAEATYHSALPTIAVFNSQELKNYFDEKGYFFEKSFVFDPILNSTLKQYLEMLHGRVGKRKQILVYGRPSTDRNAFELIVNALRQWTEMKADSSSWEVVSAGEYHPPVSLGHGKYLTSVGKLSIDEYAIVLAESYAGISLMVSPHPSYPPLEMAAFGMKVITNAYSGKDLSDFGKSIVSLDRATPSAIATALVAICESYSCEVDCGRVKESYLNDSDSFRFIGDLKRVILDSELNGA